MEPPAKPEFDTRRLWAPLTIVAIFIGAAILLRIEGRLWMCACDKFLIWAGKVCSAENSQQLLDPYSFTHVLHGFMFFWLVTWVTPRLRPAWQLSLAIAIEALWEAFENTNFIIDRYRSETAALGYNGDTVVNSFGDILCCLVGFLVAKRLGLRRSLLVFLGLELILIFWIRDSLLLEMLMLVSPVDSIKAWQMCR